MTIFRGELGDRPYSNSVPLYDQREKINKKLMAQDIWSENRKRLSKNSPPKTLRLSDKLTKKENPPHASDFFLAALSKQKEKQQRKRRYDRIIRPAMDIVKNTKKQICKEKDMQHPEYKPINMYRYNAFRNHILMRSSEYLTAAQAWALLEKCWTGFKQSYAANNMRGMRYYGRGIQKYQYVLEEVVTDFSNIGLKPYKEFF